MEELSKVRERAGSIYRTEREHFELRKQVSKDRNRLRKVRSESLTDEARDELRWWGVRDLSTPEAVERGMRYVLDEMLKGDRGVDEYASIHAALRLAGFELLDWLSARGTPITATKFGTRGEPGPNDNLYYPSYAVEFLATQFALIDPNLDAEDPQRPGSNLALDIAYRVARTYITASG